MAGRERDAGGGSSPYVLMLREHGDAGRGYALELAPLPGGGAPPRSHGHGSTGEAAAAGAGTAPRRHGGSPTTEAARGTSRARGGSPGREAAAGTGAGTASRAHGSSPTREAATGRSPRARCGSVARALFLTPRARGRGTAVEAGTGTPPRANGGRTRTGAAAATGGGATSGAHGDAAGGAGADLFVAEAEYDPAGAALERIVQDMRDMIFSPSQGRVSQEERSKISDAEYKNGNADTKGLREVLIPVFLSPKKRGKDGKEDDEIWNKRQIMYIFVLTTTAGLVFLLQPLLPAAFGRWIIMVVAAAWGAGSIGLPCGLHGTARCEKECSRHVGRFIYTLFSVLVIYGFYLAAMRIGDAPAPTPSPSLKGGDRTSADSNGEFSWAFCFGMIGLFVLLGNLWSSVRGCCTGGDRDP
ncbi:uncharacterized transmembrane protein DDB_G0289901-like isoform X2 [Panicum virgatum]|uniref:uncharacterized transmembrane protein DDB_G0289901-like isoform X2 n=1 Tax=Panicum virgatum TaxID=38727 RepID=UPI0019D6A619|nr:uncharacterized transmembrane protein DDB_G0289901-like isoform X2 [Panicum virgatum]